MTTRIHVNQSLIRKNQKDGLRRPVLRVQRGKGRSTYCDRVEIKGPSAVVYQPDDPLSCGARVWIETDAPVIAEGVVQYAAIAK